MFPAILNALARVFAVLKLLRFQFLMILAGAALSFVPAIHDAWYSATDQSGGRMFRSLLGITCAALAAAFTNWYTARLLLKFQLPHLPGVIDVDRPSSLWALQQLPRILGSAVLAIVAVTALALGGYWEHWPLFKYGVLMLVITVLFYGFLVKRRDWQPGARPFVEELRDTQSLHATPRTLWNQLPPMQRRIGVALAAVIVGSLAVGIFFPVGIVQVSLYLNVISVVLLGAILIAPVGTLLAYLSNYYRIPLFTLLAIWVLGVSFFNENHDVRLCGGKDCVARRILPQDYTLGDYANAWIDKHGPQKDRRLPAIIVASEGGGVRSAYWTAEVLDYLERRTATKMRPFSQSVFAISGVSGGSVGAAIYAARTSTQQPCPDLDRVFASDVLTPTVASLFFSDLPQRLLPLPVVSPDRAATLETQWEHEFCHMDQPFDSLSPADGSQLRPLLLLNSTAVGSGRRVVVSPLRYTDPSTFNDDFPEALDGTRLLGTTSLPASSAALTSARFPLVSPAGVARPRDRCEVVRLVDGGYFENSGTATARDVLAKLRKLRSERKDVDMDIGILIIRNNPKTVEPGPDNQCTGDGPMSYLESRRTLAPEALSPLRAFFNAWSKASDDVRHALITDVKSEAFAAARARRSSDPSGTANDVALSRVRVFEISLYDFHRNDCYGPAPRLPLSWLLSDRSVVAMHSQLDADYRATAEKRFGKRSDAKNDDNNPVAPLWAIHRNELEVKELMKFLGNEE